MLRLALCVLGLLLAAGGAGAQGWEDTFDGEALNARWAWRVPTAGPTLSLTDRPGWLRITIPQREQGYNHWNDPLFDDAPQLRTALPEGDWTLEAHVELQKFDQWSHFCAGLLVGMSDKIILTWGPLQGPNIPNGPKTPEARLEVTGTSGLFRAPGEAKDLFLRLTRKGNTFRAWLRRGQDEWIQGGTYTFPQPPRFLGLIGKTFAPTPGITFDVDYVKLSFPQDGAGLLPPDFDPPAPVSTNPPAPVVPPVPVNPPAVPPVPLATPALPAPVGPVATLPRPAAGGLESPSVPAPAIAVPIAPTAGAVTPQMIALGKRMCEWGDEHLRQGKAADAAACFRVVLLYLPQSPRAKAGLAKALAGKQ